MFTTIGEHVLSQEDPFMYVYECLSGTHGPRLMDYTTERYTQIVIDNGFHPDDDFEDVIEAILESLEKECFNG